MKKLIALLLALCLVCGMLGCDAAKETFEGVMEEVTKDTLFEKTGFSITLPAYTVDSSKGETATVDPYVLVAGDIIVCAMEQYKEVFGYDMTAQEYAQLLVDSNGYNSVVETKDGMVTFTFTSEEDGLTYLCITQVTDNAFWFINAACDSKNFEKYHDTMWGYLSTAQTSATGAAFMPAESVTVEDLTLTFPAGGYTDISGDVDTSTDFVYMVGDKIVLMGLREEKTSLAEEYQALDAYAQGLIDSNGLESALEYRDGIPSFVYTSDDGEFTYLAAALESADAFWFIQGYSFTEDFAEQEATIWSYLSSAQVN